MAYRAANDVLALPGLVNAVLERRLSRHLGRVSSAMASYSGADCYRSPHWGMSLRRLDRDLFAPTRRDRLWFEKRFGLPAGHLILMYAGKLNAGKNVPLLAPIVQQVRSAGVSVHLLCAGAGTERTMLEAMLGSTLTCADPQRRPAMGRAARMYVEARVPSWAQVAAEDLLPVWRAAAWQAKAGGRA